MAQPPSKTLDAMLRMAAAGDEEAWRRIVEAYAPRVLGLIRAQCGNSVLAEEITQSTFCTVVTRIGQYAEVGRFESWLFRIAMNRLRDEMRRRRRQARAVESEVLVGLAGAGQHGPAAPTGLDEDEAKALAEALDRLSEADRRVIHLRHFAALSFAGIAEVLGEPLGTILARHHRALRKLRRHLEVGGGRSPQEGREEQ